MVVGGSDDVFVAEYVPVAQHENRSANEKVTGAGVRQD